MAMHKGLMKSGFALPQCEKHFHEHDETWLILSGRGDGYWIDHDGRREEFVLEAGDVWLIPAGYEHGSQGPNSADFTISVFNGTYAPGCHEPKHYYVENEGYIPSLQLVRTPTNRYAQTSSLPPRMKGIMFVEKGKAALQEEETPVCRPGFLLCETLCSGLTNGTERNVLLGGNYGGAWPSRCGYQNVGRVLEVGDGVRDYAVGDVVFSGNFGQHVAYFAVDAREPDSPQNLTIKLDASIDLTHAALFGMASVAVHDVRRAGVALGERVLVVGAGGVGLFTAQAARAAGARVTVCDLDERRLEPAAQLGAHATAVTSDDATWARLKEFGPFDTVFEDSGTPVLDKIIGVEGLLKPRGKIVLVAGRGDVTYSFNAGQMRELTLLQASHFERDDLQELHRLVCDGAVQVGPLLQDVAPIDEAVAIYDRLRDQPDSLLGTVFDWRSTGRN